VSKVLLKQSVMVWGVFNWLMKGSKGRLWWT